MECYETAFCSWWISKETKEGEGKKKTRKKNKLFDRGGKCAARAQWGSPLGTPGPVCAGHVPSMAYSSRAGRVSSSGRARAGIARAIDTAWLAYLFKTKNSHL